MEMKWSPELKGEGEHTFLSKPIQIKMLAVPTKLNKKIVLQGVTLIEGEWVKGRCTLETDGTYTEEFEG